MVFDRMLALVRSARHLGLGDAHAPSTDPERTFETATGVGDDALSVVGRENEALRRRHEDILDSLRSLALVEDEVAETFQRAETLFDELAKAKSELARAEAVGRVDREARDAAMARNAELGQSYERTRSELETVRAEAQRLAAALAMQEAEGKKLENDNSSLAENVKKLEDELAAALDRTRLGEQDLEAVRAELKAADSDRAQLDHDLSEALERVAIAERAAAAVELQLEETRTHVVRLVSELTEEKSLHAALRNRARAVEAELETLQQNHVQSRLDAQRDSAAAQDQIAALTAKLTHAEAIEAVRERILQDLQRDAAEKAALLTGGARAARESELSARQADEMRQAADKARERAESQLAAAQAAQKRMLARVSPLIAALRERTNVSNARAAMIVDLEARLDARVRQAGDAMQSAEARAAMLTAELETERSRRLLAEAALTDDRARRVATIEEGDFSGAGPMSLGGLRVERRRPRSKKLPPPHHAA